MINNTIFCISSKGLLLSSIVHCKLCLVKVLMIEWFLVHIITKHNTSYLFEMAESEREYAK